MARRDVGGRLPMIDVLGSYLKESVARFDGPLHFRLIAQPRIAILLAARDGYRDARAGRSPYAWTVLTNPGQRHHLLTHGWRTIWRVFILAYVLDVIYQVIEFRTLKAFWALRTALILAVIPYVIFRGPINRLIRLIEARGSKDGSQRSPTAPTPTVRTRSE
jgi:hypothetical protein